MRKMHNIFNNIFKALYIFVGFISIVVFTGSGTICYFKTITGLPCPGCGLTRAFISLYKGNMLEAFVYHPLWLLVLLVAFVIFFKKHFSISYKLYNSNFFWVLVVLIFILCYTIRMMLLFPFYEPMTYNNNSLFYFIYKYIFNLFTYNCG